MTDYLIWFSLAGVLVFLEILTGTFYLLMIAIGSVAGGIVAWLWPDAGYFPQFVSTGIVAAIGVAVLRRTSYGKGSDKDASIDPNVNLDIGQTLYVESWDAQRRARVQYRGAFWNCELTPTAEAASGNFIIREIRNNSLIVDNVPA